MAKSARARLQGGGVGRGRYARKVPDKPALTPAHARPVRREMAELMRDWTSAERARAQKAVDFFEVHLRHHVGQWAGQPFRLELWQERIVRELFGRLRPDGTRRYRTAYIAVPRKNGKSTLAGGIALYLLAEDDEPAAEVYSAAGDRAQARIVFRTASQMISASPHLQEKLIPFRHHIESVDGTSSYRVLSADATSQHGLNVHGAVVDEVHVQPHRDLWDVLMTGTGARRQPMVVGITTAGFDRNSICWELHEYARKIREGLVVDESFYSAVYEADESDDWTSPATWAKANPNLGVSVSIDYLRAECEKAQVTPAYEGTFRRLHLNQWTQQETRYIPMQRWDACSDPPIVEADHLGAVCYSGLDLSSTLDITALVHVFPQEDGSYRVVPRFWMPGHDIHERSRREGVPYDVWARQGLIALTEGEVIDYSAVRDQILEDSRRFKLCEIAFDRWGAAQISGELDAAGVTVIPFGQGFGSMSAPTKSLVELLVAGKLRHGGNPVLRWMADCVSVMQDPAGNIKPVKPDRRKSAKRIDGIVALIMAIDRAGRHGATMARARKLVSVYETRGVLSV